VEPTQTAGVLARRASTVRFRRREVKENARVRVRLDSKDCCARQAPILTKNEQRDSGMRLVVEGCQVLIVVTEQGIKCSGLS
jgi:hypothetical protein